MPNAKNYERSGAEKILLVGPPGSGKTTLCATVPGRKFAYIFDPGALNSLAGWDIDYETFFPDAARTDPVPLDKKSREAAAVTQRKLKPPTAADRWDKHFQDALDSGFFDQYDVVIFDGLTMFAEIIMDKLLWLNGRYGQAPREDDYSPVMTTIFNTFRTVNSFGCVVVVTAHEELMKDGISLQILAQILIYGKLKYRMPAMFSEIYHCEGQSNAKGRKWILQTVQDSRHPYIRSSIKGLDNIIDVTLTDLEHVDNGKQGLGPILSMIKPKPAIQPPAKVGLSHATVK